MNESAVKTLNKDRHYIFNGGNFIELNTDFLKEDITDGEKKKFKNAPNLSIHLSRDQLHAHPSHYIINKPYCRTTKTKILLKY